MKTDSKALRAFSHSTCSSILHSLRPLFGSRSSFIFAEIVRSCDFPERCFQCSSRAFRTVPSSTCMGFLLKNQLGPECHSTAGSGTVQSRSQETAFRSSRHLNCQGVATLTILSPKSQFSAGESRLCSIKIIANPAPVRHTHSFGQLFPLYTCRTRAFFFDDRPVAGVVPEDLGHHVELGVDVVGVMHQECLGRHGGLGRAPFGSRGWAMMRSPAARACWAAKGECFANMKR